MVGPIHTLGPFTIPWLRGPRLVRVYAPPRPAGAPPPPVLYMFDGQNIFDDEPSFAGGWHLHRAVFGLAERGLQAPVIVGIDHGGAARVRELSPFQARSRGQAAHLVRWIAGELAPRIQRRFGVRSDPAGVAIGGSSMGGLAALYAHFHRPEVFGAALCMSPSLWYARGKIHRWIDGRPRPRTSRIYVDVGHREGTAMLPGAARMVERLRRRGYGDHELLWIADPEGEHAEHHWRRRAPAAVEFIFRPR
ncbi:MAG: alpha/beta hydrolase [Myxococcales bacterium]|nr:alpha/beta hydrolase [Myxococcales bacterium]MCB9702882.1 alpha/beta hydrolase [Myxococcales bacterium]